MNRAFQDTKIPIKSKTFWGLVVLVGGAAISQFAPGLNVDLTPLSDGGTVGEIAVILGAVFAWWGVRTAETSIKPFFGKRR